MFDHPRRKERTSAKYQSILPSLEPVLVKMATVIAHAMNMTNPWNPWIKFFIRVGFADSRGSGISAQGADGVDIKGSRLPFIPFTGFLGLTQGRPNRVREPATSH